MKLCVVNFWNGAFDGDFLEYFFNIAFDGVTYTDNPHEADLVVTSVFGNVRTDPAKTIAFIGENVRPSYVGYNYSLSFDYDDYNNRNCRLPLWYARLAWPGFVQKPRRDNHHNHGYEQLIDIDSLLRSRKLDMTGKDKFCALIANNPEGFRINIYNSLSQYKQVDGYGNMFTNPLRRSKLDILPEYKFCLCPENSYYEGYVTEKLVDAYAGGTIPLYSGSYDRAFNDKSFINYQNGMKMEYMLFRAKKLDERADYYQDMYEQPLLNHRPYLDEAIAFVRSIKNELR